MSDNSSLSKIFKIFYLDGTEEIIKGISKYCKRIGITEYAFHNIKNRIHKNIKNRHILEIKEL